MGVLFPTWSPGRLCLVCVGSVRQVVVDRPAGSLSDVDDKFVTFSELRRDFEFVGNYSIMLDACALYPRGLSLPVEISDVALFVEQFQFLTREHLHTLCVQHGISGSLTRQDKRVYLLDAVRRHGGSTVPFPLVAGIATERTISYTSSCSRLVCGTFRTA